MERLSVFSFYSCMQHPRFDDIRSYVLGKLYTGGSFSIPPHDLLTHHDEVHHVTAGELSLIVITTLFATMWCGSYENVRQPSWARTADSCPHPPSSPVWPCENADVFTVRARGKEPCVGSLCVRLHVCYSQLLPCSPHLCKSCTKARSKPCLHVQLCTLLIHLVPRFQQRKCTDLMHTEKKKSHHVYKHWITMSDSRACLHWCTPRYSWQGADWWCHMRTCSCICMKG